MTLSVYLKDKIRSVLLQLFCMVLLTCYLSALGNSPDSILLIGVLWFFLASLYFLSDWKKRKSYFYQLGELLESLDKRYLLSEVMEPSEKLEDKLYREILRKSNKSVIEKVHQLETEQKNYKEYIEGWIHEVKRPITTMKLICENHQEEYTRKLQAELMEVENDVEQALFYARSDAVYQDYHIRELDIGNVISEGVIKNKQYFIQNQMNISVECSTAQFVYGDDKWIAFIINQILINAVKYKKKGVGHVRFYSEKIEHGVRLSIEDNGIGINESELGRIFDKGFTGSNGRLTKQQATGIGLYLCKKLCQKLGIKIKAESKESEYTRIILIFPRGNYLSKL